MVVWFFQLFLQVHFYMYAMCLTSLTDSFDDRTASVPF